MPLASVEEELDSTEALIKGNKINCNLNFYFFSLILFLYLELVRVLATIEALSLSLSLTNKWNSGILIPIIFSLYLGWKIVTYVHLKKIIE